MDENELARRIMESKPEGVRSRGHPELSSMDGVDEDLRKCIYLFIYLFIYSLTHLLELKGGEWLLEIGNQGGRSRRNPRLSNKTVMLKLTMMINIDCLT